MRRSGVWQSHHFRPSEKHEEISLLEKMAELMDTLSQAYERKSAHDLTQRWIAKVSYLMGPLIIIQARSLASLHSMCGHRRGGGEGGGEWPRDQLPHACPAHPTPLRAHRLWPVHVFVRRVGGVGLGHDRRGPPRPGRRYDFFTLHD